jgi:hypothetical protein
VRDDATVEPIAVQLEQRGRIVDFPSLMGKFIKHEFTEFLIDTWVVGKDGHEQER